MARIAVIFAFILSIFLLSHAQYLPDGIGSGSESSAVAVAVRDPHEGGVWGAIPSAIDESSDGSVPKADLSRQIGLSLRHPVKLRCRHARAMHPFAIRLPSGGRHHARLIPLGGDAAWFPERRWIPRGIPGERRPFPRGAEWLGSRFRREAHGAIEPHGSRDWKPEVERKEGEHKEEMEIEERREEGGFGKRFRKHKEKRERERERERAMEMEERREEDGFGKRFRKHKEKMNDDDFGKRFWKQHKEKSEGGGIKKWFENQEKSFKKRFGEFLNSF